MKFSFLRQQLGSIIHTLSGEEVSMEDIMNVAVTGAAGQIGYSLLFRLASGEVFGRERKINLNLIELPQAMKSLEGTVMELNDCGFANLKEINIYDNPEAGFVNADWALLVGSKPRGPGMERNDLIRENGPIFVRQGKALNRANPDVKVVVVGNPCNTNCLIAMHNCKEIPASQFFAMTTLDENRAKHQLAKKASTSIESVANLAIWGNHSSTMFPDFENATINGIQVDKVITDRSWLEAEFMESVQKRGAAIIKARGVSSAASAASALVDFIKKLSIKTPSTQHFSAAVASNGDHYDIPSGIIFSFPVRANGKGGYEIVDGVELSEFAKERIGLTVKELLHERELIKDLLI